MRDFIQSLARDESGVTAVEYAILAALVVGILVLAATNFSTALETLWGTVTEGLNTANTAATS